MICTNVVLNLTTRLQELEVQWSARFQNAEQKIASLRRVLNQKMSPAEFLTARASECS